jgi:hypothetical protein
MIAFVVDENLRLVSQTAESRAVDDSVPVALKWGADVAARLRVQPPAALMRLAGIGRDLSRVKPALDRHVHVPIWKTGRDGSARMTE